MTDEKERFPKDYMGRHMADERVVNEYGYTLDLFKCRECWALTTEPALHERWHLGTPPGVTSDE